MRDALRARGDPVGYRGFSGGTTGPAGAAGFVEGLVSLTADW